MSNKINVSNPYAVGLAHSHRGEGGYIIKISTNVVT
jgi:hypothetical protein